MRDHPKPFSVSPCLKALRPDGAHPRLLHPLAKASHCRRCRPCRSMQTMQWSRRVTPQILCSIRPSHSGMFSAFCFLTQVGGLSRPVGSTVCACTSAAAELPRQARAAKSHAVVLEAIFQLTERKWLPTSTPWTSTGRPTCGSCRCVWPESSHIFAQDPLELLSDDTWEAKSQVAAVTVCRCSAQALCCEEITIVPALNTETDVDLISGPGKVALGCA